MIGFLLELVFQIVFEVLCWPLGRSLNKNRGSLLAAMGRWNRAQAKKAGL